MATRIVRQQPTKAYDCVVVDAGNGGLSAAAQLAAKGAKVLLLEQHTVPGGFATSFIRGRFEFAASLHTFCDVAPREAYSTARPQPKRKNIGLRITAESHAQDER